MSETFTTTLNSVNNTSAVKEMDIIPGMDADELRFYHAARQNLDLLKRNPSEISVSIILEYSKSLR
jgi:hypothetical protein